MYQLSPYNFYVQSEILKSLGQFINSFFEIFRKHIAIFKAIYNKINY